MYMPRVLFDKANKSDFRERVLKNQSRQTWEEDGLGEEEEEEERRAKMEVGKLIARIKERECVWGNLGLGKG